MDLGSLFLILALLILVGLFISRPFFERRQVVDTEIPVGSIEHQRSSLLAERDRVLNALQELDFDYALGKIPEEDYPEQRNVLLQHGAQVLRELDQIQVDGAGDGGQAEDAEARIEAVIASRRADLGKQPAARGVSAQIASPDDELEVMLADRRRARQEKSAGFCPQCGGPMRKSDRFCPKCGAKLA